MWPFWFQHFSFCQDVASGGFSTNRFPPRQTAFPPGDFRHWTLDFGLPAADLPPGHGAPNQFSGTGLRLASLIFSVQAKSDGFSAGSVTTRPLGLWLNCSLPLCPSSSTCLIRLPLSPAAAARDLMVS